MSTINHNNHSHQQQQHQQPHETASQSGGGGGGGNQPRPLTSDDFQAMIPAHFLSGGRALDMNENMTEAGSTVTVKVRKGEPDMPMFPAASTELGTIKETITKSVVSETVMTRITDNRLAEPLIIEVIIAAAS